MIQSHDGQTDRKLKLMPLLFTSYDNYLQSSKSFQEGLNWMEDLKICQKPTKYGQVLFCGAVKFDMANSKDTSFNNTIKSNLSLITVLFEDLLLYQVIFLVLYCLFFGGKGTPGMFDPVLLCLMSQGQRTYLLGVLNRSTPYISIGKRFKREL
jgi:hypothetical protein